MNNKKFKIVCLGEYCLPRVITTFSGLKKRKIEGEKSCPFDLAFCWDFNGILDILEDDFLHFFENIEYDYFLNENIKVELNKIFTTKLTAKVWKHEKSGIIFNHENYTDKDFFIERYQKRINNLYEYLSNQDEALYLLIASFNPISELQISRLNKIIGKYHPNRHYNILINQSSNSINIDIDNTFVINCNEEKYVKMYQGNWVKMLENHTKWILVNEFYNFIVNNLQDIIFLKT